MAILTETYEGVPAGMNLNLPAQELTELEARYLQDILLDKPGLVNRRGPLSPIAGMATLSKPGSGLILTLDPNGSTRLAALYGDNSTGNLALFSADLTTTVDFPWNGTVPSSPPSNPYVIVDSKSSLTGGCWIGTSTRYDAASPVQTLALWRGGNKVDNTTGTLSCTRGSTAVTGSGTSWLSTAVPGMFLFANTDDPYTLAYIGVIKSVTDDTHLVLGQVALHTCTAKALKLTSVRGFNPRVTKGRITTATSSAVVNGALTKFTDQGMATGVWTLYRASDYAYLGKVTSITSNLQLTLTANALQALNNERFVAHRVDGDFSINAMASTRKVGFLNATYAERQWFGNLGQQFETTSRLYFSDTGDPEGVDMSTFDGDFIDVGSSHGANTPVKAMMAAYNALVVIKDNETFGVYGSSPTQFEVKKIEDDGTLSGMSVQPYGGGVIWAGRNGIHFYDGIQADNVTQSSLGDYYKNAVRSFDPTKYRMWSMIERDHYFLFMESIQPSYAVIKGLVSSTPTKLTIVINMVTKAVTVFTNVALRGAVVLPASTGETTWFLANSSTTGYVCDSGSFFDSTGLDSFGCDGGTAGPDFFFESKKYKVGDSLRKKLFKQLKANYLAQGGGLKIDTVLGLNNVGKTSVTTFPATVYSWDSLPGAGFSTWDSLASQKPTWDELILSVFKPKRVKFLKRSEHLAFRLYQADANATRIVLGPFQLGFKLQRAGR